MIRLINKTVLGLVLFCLCFISIKAVAADESSVAGLIVSPPLTEKETAPGSNFNGKVKITNPNASANLFIDISVQDFKANGEDGEQTFVEPEENTGYSLGKWITIDKTLTLGPNETKEIPYSVSVPANAEPGGHYGVIFFSPTNKSEKMNGSGVTTIPKVGSLLLFTVPGDINYSGSIAEFKVNKNYFLESDNTINFTTRFQNDSTNHVKPQGDIVITNILGKEVTKLSVNEKMGNVLPDSIRKFENTWKKKYGIGLYKATVTLAFGDSGAASKELSFWIVPWKETAGALVLLILLIWILRHLRWGGKKDQPAIATQPSAPVAQPPVQTQTPQQVTGGPTPFNQSPVNQPQVNQNDNTGGTPPTNQQV